jgi:cell division protein FtsQ
VKRVRLGAPSLPSRQGKAGLATAFFAGMAVVAVAVAAWLGWEGYRTIVRADMFVVSGVDFKGVQRLRGRDLNELAGIFAGQNIFRADIEAAVQRARANPWIKEVRVHRTLPNRITIAFVERTPSVILDTGAERYLLDDEAVVLERLSREEVQAWPLPVVAIRDFRGRPGEQAASEGMDEAMTLIAELASRGGWRLADVTIKANTPESLSAVYAGREFKFGSGRYSEKLRRLAEVMADVNERGLELAYVDLRAERQAAVMVKKSSNVGR